MTNIYRPIVQLVNLGRMRYEPALKIQESMVRRLQDEEDRHVLLLVEHEPVYTIGIRKSGYGAEVTEGLRRLGADFVATNRGGLITFHGPGQLVAYPILNLHKFVGRGCKFKNQKEKSVMGMRWYVNTLEQTVIDCLEHEFGIRAARSPHTGVWVGDNKICAMGVHSKNLITSHGLALNCNVDLKWFSHIVPCGIIDKGVTSITRELDKDVGVDFSQRHLVKYFQKNFDCEIESDI